MVVQTAITLTSLVGMKCPITLTSLVGMKCHTFLLYVCELTLFNMSKNYDVVSDKVERHIWGIFIQLNRLYITYHCHFSLCMNKLCSFTLCIKDTLYSYLNWQRFYGLKLVLGLHRFKVYSEFVKMLKQNTRNLYKLDKDKMSPYF
jgi:hypothetical protein